MADSYCCVRMRDKAVFPYSPGNAAKPGMQVKTQAEADQIMEAEAQRKERQKKQEFDADFARVAEEARGFAEAAEDEVGLIGEGPEPGDSEDSEDIQLADEDPPRPAGENPRYEPAPEYLAGLSKKELLAYADSKHTAKLDPKLTKEQLVQQIQELEKGV